GVIDRRVHRNRHELERALESSGQATERHHERGTELIVLDRTVTPVERALAPDRDHEPIHADETQPVVVDRKWRLSELTRAKRPSRNEIVAAQAPSSAQDRRVLARLL